MPNIIDILNFLFENPVVVALVAATVGYLASHLQENRRREWERSRELEKIERENIKAIEETTKIKQEQILDIYTHCIQLLGVLSNSNVDGKREIETNKEVQYWISRLSLHLAEFDTDMPFFDRLDRYLDKFSRRTDPKTALKLKNIIRVMSAYDPVLHPEKSSSFRMPIDVVGRIAVSVQLSEEFRRQQFMEGTQLEPWHTIFISVQDISPSQRELLWNVYKPNDLFDDFILRLPKNKKWDRDGGNWIISFNPEHVEPEELFRRWETAYKEALEIVLANDGEEQ